MKWASLLKDLQGRVGITQSPSTTFASSSSSSPASTPSSSNRGGNVPKKQEFDSPSRDKIELEMEFKRCWDEFRSSNFEKEKEAALNMTVDIFCRLVKQDKDVGQVITMLVETHVFSFVVGRAFVTDIEKLKISRKSRSLDAGKVLSFFSDTTKDGIRHGSNLLYAVEILVSGPIDKQSLLDSGILCCLIHILSAILGPDGGNKPKAGNSRQEDLLVAERSMDTDFGQVRQLEVEGTIVHIMKALASHPFAAQCLIEDTSLQILFEIVANGSLRVFLLFKEGVVPLHTIQLHRHAMQILGLLLVSDNGTIAKYIRKHHLIKVLLLAVKDFNPECGDPAYTMGIIDLLLECVELSCRPESGGVRLREDIHNAHGYQYLVQFALVLSKESSQETYSKFCSENDSALDSSQSVISERQFYVVTRPE